MALSDEDFEKIGKLVENAVERRFQEFRAEMVAWREETNLNQIGLVQEMQAMEKRLLARFDKLEVRFDKLEVRFDKLEARVENLEKRADVQERELALVKSLILEMQQTIRKIYNEHGAALAQLQDSITMLYKRQNLLEQRADHLDFLFKQRFSAPPTP
jgi:chromosome segregation ATPase